MADHPSTAAACVAGATTVVALALVAVALAFRGSSAGAVVGRCAVECLLFNGINIGDDSNSFRDFGRVFFFGRHYCCCADTDVAVADVDDVVDALDFGLAAGAAAVLRPWHTLI
jgi:hypothetical protein